MGKSDQNSRVNFYIRLFPVTSEPIFTFVTQKNWWVVEKLLTINSWTQQPHLHPRLVEPYTLFDH